MNPNWLSTCVYYIGPYELLQMEECCVSAHAIRLNCCLLLHHDFFLEFKVKVKKIYVGKICPPFNQLIILELGNNGGTLIKPIQLLEWFSESVKSFSRSMEKAWPSVTLSEYPCSAISGLIGISSGANFGVHMSRKDRTLIRYSLWWDLQVDLKRLNMISWRVFQIEEAGVASADNSLLVPHIFIS